MRIFGILGIVTLIVTTLIYLETFQCLNLKAKPTREELAYIPKRLIRQVTASKARECGSKATVTSFSGKISSPNYPNSYYGDIECQWHLTAAREGGIVLRIIELNIEALSNCSYDYLDIYLGSTKDDPLLSRLCGQIDNYEIPINSSQVLLVFISDSTFEETGFEIEYHLDSTSTKCDQVFTDSDGMVTSPGYPEDYPMKSDCFTLITVPEKEIIYLAFDFLKLESDSNCSYDYCAIYDGPNEESPLLGRFCISESPITLKSTNNTVLIHFHSDYILSYQGFALKYSTEGFLGKRGNIGDCGWNQSNSGGNITSPNYPNQYPSNSRCKINIMAPEDHFVQFTFADFNVEPDSNCTFDMIKIQEGFERSDEKTIGVYCGTYLTTLKVLSTTNNVLFTFSSDSFSEYSGFSIRFEFIEDPAKKKTTTMASLTAEDFFVQISPNATVQEEKRHAISCIPRSPTAKTRWFKENVFIGPPNSKNPVSDLPKGLKFVSDTTLEIEKMSRHLVGKYTCTIVSTEQSSINATIWIGMSFKNDDCHIILRDIPYDVTLTERIDYKLMECSSPSSNVTITWEKEGRPLIPSDKFSFLPKGHLFLDKLEPADAGFYTCVAKDNVRNCERREVAIVNVKPLQKVKGICGLPKKGHPCKDKPKVIDGRIVNGSDAEKGAYPWQVMIWEPKRKTFCGGVLLNERWFISVAHCFTKSVNEIKWNDVRIRLGKLDQSEIESEEFSTVIGDVVLHPSFNKQTYDNDVALIRLKEAVTFTDYILPICLGDAKFIEESFFSKENQLGIVTGWGKLAERGGVPRILKQLQLPIVQRSVCQSATNNVVTRNMFCAGYAQEILGDACQGDSGGPFVTEKDGRWYLPGLVSWGEGCAQKGKYGVYTKVNNYHSWIKDIISN